MNFRNTSSTFKIPIHVMTFTAKLQVQVQVLPVCSTSHNGNGHFKLSINRTDISEDITVSKRGACDIRAWSTICNVPTIRYCTYNVYMRLSYVKSGEFRINVGSIPIFVSALK